MSNFLARARPPRPVLSDYKNSFSVKLAKELNKGLPKKARLIPFVTKAAGMTCKLEIPVESHDTYLVLIAEKGFKVSKPPSGFDQNNDWYVHSPEQYVFSYVSVSKYPYKDYYSSTIRHASDKAY